jgi:hypothetical protein
MIRRLRRVRTSTWVLLAIFLVALAAYLYFRPDTGKSSDSSVTTHPGVSPTPTPTIRRPTPTPRPAPHRTPTVRPSRTGSVEPTPTPTSSPSSVGTVAPTVTPDPASSS